MAVRSHFRSSLRTILFVGLCAGVAACARSAPELPPDYGSVDSTTPSPALSDFDEVDAAMSCTAIADEKARLRRKMAQLNAQITGKHGDNQVAGYVGGVLFPPLLLATDHSLDEKEALDKFQDRVDRLALLQRIRACP